MTEKSDTIPGCLCSFAQRMNGDGCHICNPELNDELQKEQEKEENKMLDNPRYCIARNPITRKSSKFHLWRDQNGVCEKIATFTDLKCVKIFAEEFGFPLSVYEILQTIEENK